MLVYHKEMDETSIYRLTVVDLGRFTRNANNSYAKAQTSKGPILPVDL
jgi:hypothetical protein